MGLRRKAAHEMQPTKGARRTAAAVSAPGALAVPLAVRGVVDAAARSGGAAAARGGGAAAVRGGGAAAVRGGGAAALII